jgi:Zn-dependent protease with chaperone function
MRRTRLAAMFSACLVALSCVTNPYTGREQLILVSEEQELALGSQAYQEALAGETRLTDDPEYAERVGRVAERLARVTEEGQDGIAPPGFDWEFHVVDDPAHANAWCLPGGKIVVYSGIFPACADDDGLAVVLGHEIMHAVLHHGNERVSQGMLAGLGTEFLATVLGGEDEERKQLIAAAFGAAVSVAAILPFSREHETEADRLGLMLAARAGYDPRAGIAVWRRMGSGGGAATPEFLSTHPSHETRISNLEGWMPDALAAFERAPRQSSSALPAPGRARGGIAGAALTGGLTAQGVRAVTRDGRTVLMLEFSTARALYIEKARVIGPAAVDVTVDSGAGVPANERRQIALETAPAGTYKVIVEGKANGRPWSQTLKYEIR